MVDILNVELDSCLRLPSSHNKGGTVCGIHTDAALIRHCSDEAAQTWSGSRLLLCFRGLGILYQYLRVTSSGRDSKLAGQPFFKE